MHADLSAGGAIGSGGGGGEALRQRLAAAGVRFVTLAQWLRIDAAEAAAGAADAGRPPRVKLASREELLRAAHGPG